MNAKYMGTERLVDGNGQIIQAQVVQKSIPKDYWKVSIENLISNLGSMTPKAMRVIDYVLRKTNYSNNSFIGTNKAIASKCKGVGYTKVATTLSFLASHDVITRKPGVIMWNPEIVNHSRKGGVPALIVRYKLMNHEYKRVPSTGNESRTAKARKIRSQKRQRKSTNDKDYQMSLLNSTQKGRQHAD